MSLPPNPHPLCPYHLIPTPHVFTTSSPPLMCLPPHPHLHSCVYHLTPHVLTPSSPPLMCLPPHLHPSCPYHLISTPHVLTTSSPPLMSLPHHPPLMWPHPSCPYPLTPLTIGKSSSPLVWSSEHSELPHDPA